MTEQQEFTPAQAATQLLNMAQEACQEALTLFEPLPGMDDTARAELAEMARTDKTLAVVHSLRGATQALAAVGLHLQQGFGMLELRMREANMIAKAQYELNSKIVNAAKGGAIVGPNGMPL